ELPERWATRLVRGRELPELALNRGAILHKQSPPAEGLQIHLHGHAIQTDGLLDRCRLKRNRPRLEGATHHEESGCHVIAEKLFGEGFGIQIDIGLVARAALDSLT